MKKKFKDLLPKPSDAVQAMVDGLLKQSKRKKFVINMGTFGDFADEHKVCFGCAATCTIQEATKINFTSGVKEHIRSLEGRATILNWDIEDLCLFENAIDSLRLLYIGSLFNYYNINYTLEELNIYHSLIVPLHTHAWKEGLHTYKILIKELKKNGL